MAITYAAEPVDWGDVPTWVGAVLGGVGILSGAQSLRARNREALREQAKAVYLVRDRPVETPNPDGSVSWYLRATVTNGSQLPIHNVWVHMNDDFITGSPPFAFRPFIGPSDSFTLEATVPIEIAYPHDDRDRPQTSVSFRDADGYLWQRWITGEVDPPIDMSHSKVTRLAGKVPIAGPLVIRLIINRWRRWLRRPIRIRRARN